MPPKQITIEQVPIGDLKPAKYNPRKISPKMLQRLKKGIEEYGLVDPIIINKDGTIIGGHQRYKAAELLKFKAVPCVRLDLPPAKEKALNLALNKISGEWDMPALKDLLADIDLGDIDIELTGFDAAEIKDLFDLGAQEKEKTNIDAVPPPPVVPTTKPGQLFALGRHRLLCGSCTDPKNIDRLTDGRKMSLIHTDPPYGVSYVTQSGKFDMIKNDDKTRDDLVKNLLLPAFQQAVRIAEDTAAFYIWHASSTREDFAYAMKMAGLQEKQYLMWVKPQMVLGHADYHWSHEPCFYAEKEGHRAKFHGDRSQTTIWRATLKTAAEMVTTLGTGLLVLDGNGKKIYIAPKEPKGKKIRVVRLDPGRTLLVAPDASLGDAWEIDRETATDHPTQKPVELAKRAIENSTEPGQAVADFFGGSGTTLLAAEVTDRDAYLTELDPVYCDVIIRRWEEYTGKKAVEITP